MTEDRGQRSEVRRGIFCLLFSVLCLLGNGCVKRTIVIESDPPGALVWINEHPVGTTPVTHEFITHGRYKFRLEKSGFRELVSRERVRAPIYQWIPIDFFAEFLLPVHLEDRHLFRYVLSPKPPEEQLMVVTPEHLKADVEALKDPDPEKRRLACVALARAREPATAQPLLAATRDPVPIVRSAALQAWRGVQGPKAIERLLEALRDDPDREVRWQAAVELEALSDPQAVPGLIGALQDREHLVRAGAAEALKGIPDRRAVEPLIQALRDSDTAVRRAATEGLGRIGDRAAVKPLTRVLFHQDFQTRRRAVKALMALRDPAAGPALVRTFTDWDPQIREAATEALVEFGDDRVVPRLIRYLRAWKPWTRWHAAQVLGGLKDPRAFKPLKRAFEREPNPDAREIMAQALAQLEAAE